MEIDEMLIAAFGRIFVTLTGFDEMFVAGFDRMFVAGSDRMFITEFDRMFVAEFNRICNCCRVFADYQNPLINTPATADLNKQILWDGILGKVFKLVQN
jgi:hypothetical protein